MLKGLVIGCSLGNCVHVAGAVHFLELAKEEGYEKLYLGPAVSVDRLIETIREKRPVIVAVGYRLTPENAVPLIDELMKKSATLDTQPTWVFGGTKPVADAVRKMGFFDVVYDGLEDIDDCIAFLRGGSPKTGNEIAWSDELIGRIDQKRPYPLLCHHFGLPSFDRTLEGIREIAEARVLDVISLGPDQNTQQFFFQPERRDPALDGAGGVPVRTEAEFTALKEAARRGNHPLMRCYSGTADVLRMAEMLSRTISNAWCAVPLCWYGELDGRGERTLCEGIGEAQRLIAWHGERGIPVEVNEPHHWGLRDAHDVISVAAAYISAYNARKCGAKDYIAQYMFNVPGSMSFSMDLAKVLAQIELVERLSEPEFRVYRQTRAGLPFLSADLSVAKGQLAASTMLQMAVKPDIIHVVGYSEAEHAATPEVVIESCRIVRGIVRSMLRGAPDLTQDVLVQARRQTLLSEAGDLLDFIRSDYAEDSDDPLSDAKVLADAVQRGILDAPHILKRGPYRGTLRTRMDQGCCVACDLETGRILTERERLARIEKEAPKWIGKGSP